MSEDRQAVAEANEAFYAAVEHGDLDALKSIWCDEAPAVCIHPGASPIHGTRNVLRSWALIMANTDYIQFFLTDVAVSVNGDVAAVTCRENILTAADGAAGADPVGFHGGLAEALNIFVRREGDWRLWLHQAAPVLSEIG